MSYPFLPVNACCTDVVLNSPCGCTSTLPNTGCEQTQCGTNVILSSNVLYNGPVLDCIIAEPCDTLNVILQKIDEIICNLLVQINTLNIQVTNITTEVININSEIININNTLDVCCNVTTTTTTTSPCTCTTYRLVGPSVNPGSVAYVPCGTDEVVIRIGTNIVQYVCVDNTYDVIRVGNVSFINLLDCCDTPTTTTTSSSSSTSTTSTSSTTTSTTTAAPCITWQWASTGEQSSDLEYTNCNGLFTVIDQADITNSSGQICVYPDTSPAWNPAPTTGTHTLGTDGVPCVTPTTTTTSSSSSSTSTTTSTSSTTTTTTTISCSCIEILISRNDIERALGNTPSSLNSTVFVSGPKNIGCNGSSIPSSFNVPDMSYKYCVDASKIPLIGLFYYLDNVIVTVPDISSSITNTGHSCLNDGDCVA